MASSTKPGQSLSPTPSQRAYQYSKTGLRPLYELVWPQCFDLWSTRYQLTTQWSSQWQCHTLEELGDGTNTLLLAAHTIENTSAPNLGDKKVVPLQKSMVVKWHYVEDMPGQEHTCIAGAGHMEKFLHEWLHHLFSSCPQTTSWLRAHVNTLQLAVQTRVTTAMTDCIRQRMPHAKLPKRAHVLLFDRAPGQTLSSMLTAYRQRRETLLPSLVWAIATQLTKIHAMLQNVGMVHRDIKPENVLVHVRVGKNDGKQHVHVTMLDFEFACLDVPTLPMPHSRRYANLRLRCVSKYAPVQGTPLFMSPQLLCAYISNSAQTFDFHTRCRQDAWSMGAVLYELGSGGKPFVPGRVQTMSSLLTFLNTYDTSKWPAWCLRRQRRHYRFMQQRYGHAFSKLVQRLLERDDARRCKIVNAYMDLPQYGADVLSK